MITSTELLRASALDLRRITAEARLLLADRPAPADVEALRSLRVQLVADLSRFQQLVHLVLDEAAEGDPYHLREAIGLKIGAIGMSCAYDEFRSRWVERHFLNNWAEYRLSALRMINTILVAIAPVDRLPLTDADEIGRRDNKATPMPLGKGGNMLRSDDAVEAGAQFGRPRRGKNTEMVR